MTVFSEFATIISKNGNLAEDAPTFSKYFNRDGETDKPMPKFVVFLGHAENVFPLLQALDSPSPMNPPPGSMILVNYYEIAELEGDDKYQVVVSYVPNNRVDPTDVQVIMTKNAADFVGDI